MKSCFFMKLSSHRKFITNRQTSPCPSVYIETILFCLYHFAYRIYTELNILHCKTLGVVTETQFAENLLIFQPCTSTSTLTCSKLASYLKTNKGKRKKTLHKFVLPFNYLRIHETGIFLQILPTQVTNH